MTLLPMNALAQVSSDEQLDRCRSIGLEGFVQDLIGRDVVITTTVLAFCDDYRELFEQAEESSTQLETVADNVSQLLQTTRVLTAQVSALQEELKSLRDRLPPEDAIMLVDDADGCPTGWIDVAAREPQIFAGRTIVARGFHSDRQPREYRDTGGEEEHLLEWGEMPPHTHSYEDTFVEIVGGNEQLSAAARSQRVRNKKAEKETSEAGRGEPHNNMPPFIALYYCKKD